MSWFVFLLVPCAFAYGLIAAITHGLLRRERYAVWAAVFWPFIPLMFFVSKPLIYVGRQLSAVSNKIHLWAHPVIAVPPPLFEVDPQSPDLSAHLHVVKSGSPVKFKFVQSAFDRIEKGHELSIRATPYPAVLVTGNIVMCFADEKPQFGEILYIHRTGAVVTVRLVTGIDVKISRNNVFGVVDV